MVLTKYYLYIHLLTYNITNMYKKLLYNRYSKTE